jgi:DNA (cytosine-5)-methyltransferase 1
MGFEDTRGTIFFEIARIAKEKRPPYLFLENVKGLLSHDKGRTFDTIISTLDEMGYDAEWQVLNSKYFVPQNRERVFIIGHLRGERTRQIFPLGEMEREFSEKTKERQTTTALDSNYWKGIDNHGARTVVAHSSSGRSWGREERIKIGEANTLSTGDRCRNQSSVNYVIDYTKIRKLTPKECERLQGFPDNWTIGSDTQRYKQMGNAVTVPVVEYIARELKIG